MKPAEPEPEERPPPAPRSLHGGLCPRCVWVRVLTSDRGSTFLQCGRAKQDARFPRYPPQPVVECPGYEPNCLA
jgi:hypothetical protein